MIPLSKRNIETSFYLKNKMLHWNLLYDLLTREFTRFNLNNDINEVGYKVELVDKLYNCNLRQDIRKVAQAICDLNLDSQFESDVSGTIVKKIAEIQLPMRKTEKKYKLLGDVFASKYCHFHYPHSFPIIDSFSKIALSNLLDKKSNYYDKNYAQFVYDINNLKKKIEFEVTYAQLDGYLWLYGQWLEYKNKNHCSLDFRYLVEHESELLEHLSPGR